MAVICLLIACGSDDTTCPTGQRRIGTSCYRPAGFDAGSDAGDFDPEEIQEGCDAPIVVYVDSDGDGYGGSSASVACEVPAGYSKQGGDCADDDPSVHPGANDLCNGVDDDCDPSTADGWGDCGRYACGGDACLTSCVSHDQCATGFWCHAETAKCLPKLEAKLSCTANAECASGACQCVTRDCGKKACVEAPCEVSCMFLNEGGTRCDPLEDKSVDESCSGPRACYQGQCKVNLARRAPSTRSARWARASDGSRTGFAAFRGILARVGAIRTPIVHRREEEPPAST